MSELSELDQLPLRTVNTGNQEYLYFGGTGYLGIGANAEFQDYCIEGMKKLGFSNGTSRSNNVQLGIFEQAEEEASLRFGSESALICSSGFLAGQLAVRYFSNFGEIIYGPNSHPAVWLASKPVNHQGFEEWALQTVDYINSSAETRFVIISDSLNNFRPRLFDFSLFSTIDASKHVVLLIDDSHGIGVTHHGKGIFSSLPSESHIHSVVVASLAKAVGIDAGVVLADRALISQLKALPMFLAASPPSPAFLYAFLKSEHLYQECLARLKSNLDYFNRQGLKGLQYTPGFPVYYAENPGLYHELLEKGIVISSFNYPQPTDPLMNRIVINSLHTEADLLYLLKSL